jgi:hypothetical protein
MKTGLSLEQLAARITANAALKADYVRSTKDLEVSVQQNEGGQKPTIVLNSPDGSFPIRPIAHDQIGAYAGIPAKYYDRCLAEAPELLASNVNTWFHRKPEPRLVRTLGGDTRSFHSNAYNRIENEEIAATVLPILYKIPGAQVTSSELTEKRLYLQVVTPLEREITKNGRSVGDIVQAGVLIQNSEVGHGAVSVLPLIWRLWCKNGAYSQDGKFRANHVGRRVEEGALAQINYADDTRQADDRAVLLKLRDHVHHAIDVVAFETRVKRLSDLSSSKEIVDPAATVGLLAKKFDLSEGEGAAILRSLATGGGTGRSSDLSAWGLVNAVTHQAHSDAVDYDRAVEFEALGGKLIDLPKAEWQELLEAA